MCLQCPDIVMLSRRCVNVGNDRVVEDQVRWRRKSRRPIWVCFTEFVSETRELIVFYSNAIERVIRFPIVLSYFRNRLRCTVTVTNTFPECYSEPSPQRQAHDVRFEDHWVDHKTPCCILLVLSVRRIVISTIKPCFVVQVTGSAPPVEAGTYSTREVSGI
ncbi:hypothetical protein BAUCODRAFT_204493 [Baudoinia panamericana UAMH 10762]|uniref:Uncharacterized protein n=1 Tax=Baudoinia panamericana (strain UAMH 10762) TaxID=717646 RepID=M2M2D0_BAUPA|nr:uncharacterized protein BAUCODRAFT_204493 [Baudoinia panamericana UAMH 10762]EMD01268.1 hypothetical protein BAUCODRAFT_204493 [Baudoinia panamericana UAMH 10762]